MTYGYITDGLDIYELYERWELPEEGRGGFKGRRVPAERRLIFSDDRFVVYPTIEDAVAGDSLLRNWTPAEAAS